MHPDMLTRALTWAAVAALAAGAAPVSAKPKPAPAPQPQSQSDDGQFEDQPRAAQPYVMAPQPMPVLQPPPAGFMPVMTIKQKQCRVQHQCPLDPRFPCPPC